jgi:glycosyltransferase involved in cell wall biosynthesis
MRSADLFVYLSRADTFGLVVAEAMACGTPVLATNVGGLPGIVVDGRTGWLVEPGAPAQDVARRLTQLLGQGQALIDMGAQASAWIARHFSLELMGDRYLNLYRSMTVHAG